MNESDIQLTVHIEYSCVILEAYPLPVCYCSEFAKGKKDSICKRHYEAYDKG
jgi:hypothetical protein